MARNSLIPYAAGGLDPVLSLHREMNRLFDDVFRTGFGGRSGASDPGRGAATLFNADMNVSETDKEIRVAVELPGVTEQDIDISLNDDLLTIRGEKKFEAERGDEKENYHYAERSYGTFQRSLRLPFHANPDEVKAAFQNGVLTVTLPKSAQQERSRRIQIQGSGPQAEQPRVAQQDGGGAEGGAMTGGGQPAPDEQPGATH